MENESSGGMKIENFGCLPDHTRWNYAPNKSYHQQSQQNPWVIRHHCPQTDWKRTVDLGGQNHMGKTSD